jgi:internalin A
LCNFAELDIIEKAWEGFYLTKIDLSNNLIPEVPEELATQVDIQHINLNTNELTSIPASLFTLENLKFLDISHNKIGNPKV